MIQSDVNNIIKEVGVSILPTLKKDLNKRANAAKWPEGVVPFLDVDMVDGSIVITYPQELQEQIEDLEYGKTSMFPNPVLRPFVNSASIKLQWAVEAAFVHYIERTGGIW